MTKATRILNEFHIKEMLLHGNPQFENFYKEELIQFCEIGTKLLKKYKSRCDNAMLAISNIESGDYQEFCGYGGEAVVEALQGSEDK